MSNGASSSMSRLGRLALLSYPAAWRSSNGDVVLSTLAEVAEGEGRTTPRASQLVNVALSGLALRLDLIVSLQARNVISTVAVGSGAAFALAFLVVHTWSPWAAVNWPNDNPYPHFGPFLNLGVIVYTAWIIALILFMAHKIRAARIALAAAFIASVVLSSVNLTAVNLWMGPSITSLGFLAALSVLALIGTPAASTRLALITAIMLAQVVLVYVLEQLISDHYVSDRAFWRAASFYSVISLVGLGIIVSIVLGMSRRGPLALLALSSTGVWALVFFTASLRQNVANTVAVSAVILFVVGLALVGRTAIRRSTTRGGVRF